MFSARQICENFVAVNYCFPKNSTTKNAFLAVCRYIDENVDLREVNLKAPFGGKIGPGDSKLDNYLKFSKVLRMHAIFHDAYGYMRSFEEIGPGYVYTLTKAVFPQQYASRTFLRNIILVIRQIVPSRAFRCFSILTIICTLNIIPFSCILKWRYINLIQNYARL